MSFWRSAPITRKTRERMNAALIGFHNLIGNVIYPNGSPFPTHHADLGDLFSKLDPETGELTPIGARTIGRWYGMELQAASRCIPAFADGHRPLFMYPYVAEEAPDAHEVMKDGIGRPLNRQQIQQVRLRVYLCTLTGYEPDAQPGDKPIGLSRAANWHGKPYVIRYRYAKCSDALLVFDAVIQGRPVTPGKPHAGGSKGEAALIQYGWTRAYIEFAYPGTEEPWLLHIDGFTRAQNKSLGAGDTPEEAGAPGSGGATVPGRGGEDGEGGGTGGGGGGGGAGGGEGYEELEPFTDDEGDIEYYEDDEDEGE